MARKQEASADVPDVPAFYVATEDLFMGSPDAGAMPVAAFRKGDRVPPALVDEQGWGDKVNPRPATAPEVSAASPGASADLIEPPEEAAVDMPEEAGKE